MDYAPDQNCQGQPEDVQFSTRLLLFLPKRGQLDHAPA